MVKRAVGEKAQGRSIILRLALSAGALLLAVGGLLAWAPAARADSIYVYSYDVEEEYRIRVDEVGNAACTDLLTYDRSFFNKAGFNFDHYPFLLSRRYCEPADIREIENFNADIDTSAATITVTFDRPGEAYNEGTHWIMYGFYSEPRFEVDGQQVFQEESTVNNEFTLWEDLEFKTTTYVRLPEGTRNVRYDTDKHALTWELPYLSASGGSFLARNSGIFIPLSAVLIAAGLAIALVSLLRRPRPAPAVTVALVPPGVPEGQGPSLYCRYCGGNLRGQDSRFCPMCGRPTQIGQ